MTFNISTAAAFVAAGAGIPVIKHGNRAQTGRSGSADLLTALGVSIDASEEQVIRSFQEANIAFLSAPTYHPALKTLSGLRSELGFRTILNISGPLCNPAGPINRIIGVADPALLGPMAEALQALGVKKALVVSGDQLDELSLTGENRICELSSGQIDYYTLNAADLGLAEAPRELLVAGSPEESAAIISRVLHGGEGPARDIILLNAAGAILAGGGSTTFSSALKMAEDAIDSGRALESLRLLAEINGGA
jgi:anthranilate phosphoribosyltransferase